MMKKKIIPILTVIILLSCFFFIPKIKASTLEEQKQENQGKREQAEKDLEYVQEELSEAVVKIQELDDKIRTAENEIAGMDEKLIDLQTKVEETTQNLQIVQKNYDENRKIMENRLVVMYECGDVTYLDLLLRSSSLVEFLSNYYIIEEIVRSDNELLASIEKEKDEIETTKKQLEQQKAELKLLKVKQEQTRIIMQNNKTIQQNEIDKLSDNEKELQQKIQEYKDEEARIENLIKLASGQYTYNGEYSGGVMAWPIAKEGTYITSNYGTREHPIQGIIKTHTGIDIGNAGFGAPVIAAADGIVSMASYYGGYGNCVMINHGNGISTLYGHGQKILTTVGAEVKKGDLIMEVGSTGLSTGPHLHFEVRINGVHTNPLQYLQ
jgi:peptidase m23b precursor